MSEDQWKSFALWMPRTSNDRIWGGGTGRSWIIRQILGDMEIVFGSAGTHGRVLLITHQGSAAFLIGGRTLSSALGLPSQPGSTFRRDYAPLASTPGDSSTLRRLQNEYEHVHIIIIDDFGVVSCGMLYWIDQRLREIFPSNHHEAFGGRDVLFIGDPGQLGLIKPSPLATPISHLCIQAEREGRKLGGYTTLFRFAAAEPRFERSCLV